MPHSDGKNKKISELVGITELLATANFVLEQNGATVRIPANLLLAALGVTGTIIQGGDPLAAPILDKAGTVNTIRNAKQGPGIKTSIPGDNSLLIEHDFIASAVGTPLLVNSTTSPIIASLVGSTGINISSTSPGVVAIGATLSPPSTKTILINTASDFPAVEAGAIPLEDNFEYRITNDVTITDPLRAGINNVISANAASLVTLTYTGTGDMLILGSSSMSIKEITLSSPSAQCMAMAGLGTGLISLENVSVKANKIGTFNSPFIVSFRTVDLTAAEGVTFLGASMLLFLADHFLTKIDTGEVFDLGSVVACFISVSQCIDNSLPGVTFISGLPNSGNVEINGTAKLLEVVLQGGATTLSGISPDDQRWIFLANNLVRDTKRDALISVQGNALETTISVINTPVKVNAVWVEERVSGYTTDATGTITQDLFKDITAPITATVSAFSASGSNVAYTFYVAINSSVVTATAHPISLSSANVVSTTLVWDQVLSPGDTVEIFVENNDNTINAIIDTAVIRVN